MRLIVAKTRIINHSSTIYALLKNENVKPSSYTVKIDLFHVLSKLFE